MSIQSTVISDGQRIAVVHIVITQDGSPSGEMVNTKIFDFADLPTPAAWMQNGQVTINQLWWGQSYFDSVLLREDTVPVPIWVMPVGSDSHVDFRSFGGIKVPVSMEGTGNLLLSTYGYAPLSSTGSYVIEFKKN
jgi:hypothetical protein